MPITYNKPLYGKMDPKQYVFSGGIDRSKITDPHYLNQLQMGNVDDAGNGTWNTSTGMWTDKQGRAVRQIGSGQGGGYGAFQPGQLLNADDVWYDDDLGYVTGKDNFKENEDDLGGFGTLVKLIIGAGAGAGILGLGGAGAGAGQGLGAAAGDAMAGAAAGAGGGVGGGAGTSLASLLGGGGAAAAGAGAGWTPGSTGLLELASEAPQGGSFLSNIFGGGGSSILSAGRTGLGLLSSLLGGGGGGNRMQAPGGGRNGFNLLDLLGNGAGYYMGQQNQDQFKDQIGNLINVGTGGVRPEDRAGARDLIRGMYDGTIDPQTMIDRIPGLEALSRRGADNISRAYAAKGRNLGMNSGNPDSSVMRDFLDYDRDMTNKYAGEWFDRTAKIGGYDIDPARMAGAGLGAYQSLLSSRNNNDSALLSALGRMGGGGSILGGQGGGGGSFLDDLFDIFSGGDGGGEDGYELPTGGGDDIDWSFLDNLFMDD